MSEVLFCDCNSMDHAKGREGIAAEYEKRKTLRYEWFKNVNGKRGHSGPEETGKIYTIIGEVDSILGYRGDIKPERLRI